ncbi:chemosensory receptor c [Plakobranchus ocellatus]|uniref:Chemosensory receptor c n=1 Tax=Plakobranchus ocellatus TaxID=259542 RepID=A0AAV4B2T9_9GAST|nr:chemosensory receptor c [Plakobranchus ocellatus]
MESSSAAAAPLLNDALFKTLTDSFFTPLLVCITTLGILGNVINIMVFRQRTPMDIMTTCFIALAVSDLLYFCFFVPNFISEAFVKNGVRILNNVDIHSLFFFTMTYQKSLFNKISITITAFMAFERSLCVARPFKVKRLFTRRRVIIILTAIYLCLIVLFTPSLLSAEAVWKYPGNRTEPVLMFQPTSLRIVADYISRFMTGFSLIVVTQVIITISAGLMISGLRRHQHFRQTASSGARRPGKPERTRHKLSFFTLKASLRKKTSRGSSEKAENEIEPSCRDEQSERKLSEKVALPDPNSQDAASATRSTRHNSSSQTINPAETASSKEIRLIKTVLGLAVMHVILTFPSLIFFVTQNLIPELRPMRRYNNIFYLGAKIITISNSLNGMLGTLVYLTLNERYKIQFQKLFCYRRFNT